MKKKRYREVEWNQYDKEYQRLVIVATESVEALFEKTITYIQCKHLAQFMMEFESFQEKSEQKYHDAKRDLTEAITAADATLSACKRYYDEYADRFADKYNHVEVQMDALQIVSQIIDGYSGEDFTEVYDHE